MPITLIIESHMYNVTSEFKHRAKAFEACTSRTFYPVRVRSRMYRQSLNATI